MVGVAGCCVPARADLALVASPAHSINLSSLSLPPIARSPRSPCPSVGLRLAEEMRKVQSTAFSAIILLTMLPSEKIELAIYKAVDRGRGPLTLMTTMPVLSHLTGEDRNTKNPFAQGGNGDAVFNDPAPTLPTLRGAYSPPSAVRARFNLLRD